MEEFDVVIVGAGMAGASLAWALAPRRRVLVLERESQPGYHSTGRSAATLHSSYGNGTIRALTAASAPFYRDPPPGFAETPLARPRAVLKVAREDQLDAAGARRWSGRAALRAQREQLDASAAWRACRCCAPTMSAGGVLDPTMLDLDVAAIHAGFLRGAAPTAGRLRPRPGRGVAAGRRGLADRAARRRGRAAPVLVDAAGAWADSIAGIAGLAAARASCRTAGRRIIVQAPRTCRPPWPMIEDVAEEWYVKPDAGRLLCSPADETPDAALRRPARGARRRHLRRADRGGVRLPDPRIESRWAGLRSFAPDRTPVAGFDPRAGVLLAGRPGRLWHPDGTGAGGAGRCRDPGRSAAWPGGGADIDRAALTPARLVRLGGYAVRPGSRVIRVEQPVQVDDEVAHMGVVDRRLRLAAPSLHRLGVVREEADDVDLGEVDELGRGGVLELAAENEMSSCLAMPRIPPLGACTRSIAQRRTDGSSGSATGCERRLCALFDARTVTIELLEGPA